MICRGSTIRVRAVAGVACPLSGRCRDGQRIKYAGRRYDPSGDPRDIDSEFPIVHAEEVPDNHYFRKAVRDGSLLPADAETAQACSFEKDE